MDQRVKDELRYRIPVEIVMVAVAALTVVLMKPWGFGFLEVFTVAMCVALILHDPVTDLMRKVTAPRNRNDKV